MKIIYLLSILFVVTACSSGDQDADSASDTPAITSSSVVESDSATENGSADELESASVADTGVVAGEEEEEPTESIVYIETGAIQCEADGVTQLETALLLTNSNIEVIDSQCGDISSIMIAAQCGLPSADINLHTVPFQSLSRALALGFKSALDLEQDGDIGYAVKACKEPPA